MKTLTQKNTPEPLPKSTPIGCVKRCPIHGPYEPRQFRRIDGGTITVPGCPKCGAEKEATREKLQREGRIREALERSGIPERLQGATFAGYVTGAHVGREKAKRVVAGYAREFKQRKHAGTSLILCGRPGTGKSHLAIAAGLEIIRAGHSVRYITEYACLRAIKSCYSQNAEHSEEEVLRAYQRPALLIIDEVGLSRGSETDRLLMYQVISGRYDSVLPTLLVGNLNMEELTAHVGERVIDRLREGGGVVVPFTWDSHRK